jgi:methanogenic corrinoid protein MtbC1
MGERLDESNGRTVVAAWVQLARELNGDKLEAVFRSEWTQLGGVRFVVERAGPFVAALGEAWVDGTVDVHHEHFASERLRDFLVSTWRPLANSATGPMVVCTTLPGERHGLGLHMAAAVAVIAGLRLTFLGSDTPLQSIANTVKQTNARAVLLSVSGYSDETHVRNSLSALRELVPDNAQIVTGGSGAPASVEGVVTLGSLVELLTWARALSP